MKSFASALLVLFFLVSQLWAQISSGGAPLSFSQPLDNNVSSLTMPDVDVDALIAEDKTAGWEEAPRFGAPHDVSINLNNNGTWTTLRNGDRLWRCRIVSREAYSINLQFDEFFMPPEATLFIYNDDHSHIIGAFTEQNNKTDGRFATQPVQGDAITLEYYEPASQRARGVLSIWRVVHAYRDMFHHGSLDDFGDAAWCAVNINCPEGEDWQNEKRGVALMITGEGFRWCSGSLINNTRNDGTPYFHTAMHCTDGQNIGTMVFVFNYESPGCEVVDGPLNQSVAGGSLLFTHVNTDIALIELSSPIPLDYNPCFNGWYAEDIAPTSSACISHPATDVKKIGIDEDPAVSSAFGGTPANSHWRVVHWEAGHAEHGSSGSPLFNQDGLIIGQCHGGDGWCDDVVNHNVDYGKLAWSFDLGADQWLDPDGLGITDLPAYDPNVAGQIAGVIRNADTEEPVEDVLVRVVNGSQSTRTNTLGEYRLPLYEGTYDIDYSLWGYENHTEFAITIAEGDSIIRNIDLNPLNVVVMMDEDFESGAAGWTHAAAPDWLDDWHLSSESSHSGTSSFKCGDDGTLNYSNLLDARLSSPIIEFLPSQAQLSFWMRIESEVSGAYPDSAYDGGVVEISADGGLPEVLAVNRGYTHLFRYTTNGTNPVTGPMAGYPCFAGSNAAWRQITADLSDYEGQDIQLHFRFGSDNIVTGEGWYIDDVLIRGIFTTPPPVTGLVVWRDGDDVMLSWNSDATPYYLIYSSLTPEIPFPDYEGMTDQTSYVIEHGLQDEKRFYYVVGYMPE
ncbi:carboxypeptidase regulatory-like domain-containing protein [bacterium]|nr:carboxypeptidase regulatory-like domain-containing protein [bacterium]